MHPEIKVVSSQAADWDAAKAKAITQTVLKQKSRSLRHRRLVAMLASADVAAFGRGASGERRDAHKLAVMRLQPVAGPWRGWHRTQPFVAGDERLGLGERKPFDRAAFERVHLGAGIACGLLLADAPLVRDGGEHRRVWRRVCRIRSAWAVSRVKVFERLCVAGEQRDSVAQRGSGQTGRPAIPRRLDDVARRWRIELG